MTRETSATAGSAEPSPEPRARAVSERLAATEPAPEAPADETATEEPAAEEAVAEAAPVAALVKGGVGSVGERGRTLVLRER